MAALTLVWDGKPASRVVTAPGQDAGLLALINRFREVREVRSAEYDVLQRRKRVPDYKARWAAFQAGINAAWQMEKEIALTPARTIEGATAKTRLGYELMHVDDWEGDDLLIAEIGACRMWAVALSGTRDLLNVVGADKVVQA